VVWHTLLQIVWHVCLVDSPGVGRSCLTIDYLENNNTDEQIYRGAAQKRSTFVRQGAHARSGVVGGSVANLLLSPLLDRWGYVSWCVILSVWWRWWVSTSTPLHPATAAISVPHFGCASCASPPVRPYRGGQSNVSVPRTLLVPASLAALRECRVVVNIVFEVSVFYYGDVLLRN